MSTIAIVGAGPQLGFAIGTKFAERGGFDVALVARRASQLEAMVDRFRSAGVSAAAFPADVTDRQNLAKALAAAEEHFGSIDVLEYSPAPTLSDLADRPLVSAVDLTVEAVLPELETSFFGAVAAVRQVLPGMIDRGAGTVIGTSGAGSGPMVVPQVANANAANAALRNWLLALNESVADRGVHVAHIALGAMIGNGRPNSEPDVIADLYWKAHVERDTPEIFHYDLPEDFEFRLADKFRAD
ncbi:SDR family NAD(P)-dependent oxidoreductase [Streptomyces virens]|uniref:SDR family NAD(P)-dependent oxidoreductase n=1 Tax=Streptomyces virens TaxID=285572 RepID=A0ABP6NW65_9ACTN|nr:SDR family NAD(P)-dependent oxidoreductase [Streptomyces calvus]MBA8975492.1 NAD(P)-dependent dehydrogenase (short-subunit alcohol dehydrogenase family) [Streptomyces calvus]MYS27969.1 SDR family NAD(P)-dependent oxidoreductase [Streptomyces sp. SID7804]